ncbi:MAG: CpaF family protein [Thermogutta sp.]|nr:CpaF family protein [Thermogutta sp.]HOP75874.1 CpaF family protein [Thermogutta sp.]HPU05094.1 CpaF family protein [Thermogutta sp.]HQF12730.1 CpaF family protein [Thermogutta sp.]
MSRQSIFEASTRYFLSPILPYLEDDSVSEIMINGPFEVYIERRGKLEKTDARFPSEDALISAINNVAQWVGREIGPEHPVLDARLPDGSRVHAILPPTSRIGTCVTIRKFTKEAMTLEDLVRLNSLSEVVKEFLEICVRIRKNILISGGTGTGKTVLLGALSRAIPFEERIVVIEDTSELRFVQPHTIYLEARHGGREGQGMTIRQLFSNSLRMRPDRIIVGEVRGGEALDMIQSMLSGHSGSLSTIHASSPRDALIRLETLSLMSDVDIPVYVARAQVASAIHLVVQIARFTEDGSRKITHVTEVAGLDAENRYHLRDLFVSQLVGRNPDGSLVADLKWTGIQPMFANEPAQQGLLGHVRLSKSLWAPEATDR